MTDTTDSIRLFVNPGSAPAETLGEVFIALNNLLRSAIGVGVRFEEASDGDTIARFDRRLTDDERALVARILAATELFENQHA